VDHLKLRIDEHNAAWQAYFEQCGVEPLKVVYEEFVDAYKESVLRLLEDIGVSVPEDFIVEEPKMKRQADTLSEEWVSLYHEYKAAREM
jgi:trehalose 2-sulfotransferase